MTYSSDKIVFSFSVVLNILDSLVISKYMETLLQ